MNVDLTNVPVEKIKRDDYLLFSESQSRFVVTVSPDNSKKFEKLLKGNACSEIGTVVSEKSFNIVGRDGKTLVDADIGTLKEHWQKPLAGVV